MSFLWESTPSLEPSVKKENTKKLKKIEVRISDGTYKTQDLGVLALVNRRVVHEADAPLDQGHVFDAFVDNLVRDVRHLKNEVTQEHSVLCYT